MTASIDVNGFLDAIAQSTPTATSAFKLAIVAGVASGHPVLRFEGELTYSTLAYPYLGSYTPTISDRVLVAMVGTSGVVLGKVA